MKRLFVPALAVFLMILFIPVLAEAETYVLPAALTEIEDEVYRGNTSVDRVILPDGLLSIGNRAFAESSVREINFPESIQSIADTAFTACGTDLVAEVTFDSYAYHWCVDHGITIRLAGEPYAIPFLLPGTTDTVISEAGTRMRYRVVPTVSGDYSLTSAGFGDTMGYLYDASGTELAADDDSGDENNFLIQYSFTAGTVYYFDVCYFNASVTGEISLIMSADFGPQITRQPSDVTADEGTAVSLTVGATGKGTLAYQWQERATGSAGWQNCSLSGSRTAALSFRAQKSYDRTQYRCVITDETGFPITSDAALLTVDRFPTVSTGSTTAVISNGGEYAKFRFVPPVSGSYTLTSTGAEDTVGYLYNASGEQLIYNDDDVNTNFLIQYDFTGNTVYYFAVGFWSSSQTGNITLLLTADFGPQITGQPSDATADDGSYVSFTLAAEGRGTLMYQWQERQDDSSAWQSCGLSGSKTETLTVLAKKVNDRRQYRCVVTDENGFSATSDGAVLYVASAEETRYRALFIGEVNYEGDMARPGVRVAISNLSKMLKKVSGPSGGHYTVYGGNNEYEDASPTEILDLISTVFADATANDVSLFYIGAHGVDSVDGVQAGAIGTVGSSPEHRYYCGNSYYIIPNHLFIDELAREFKKVPGRVIILIDTCGSGAGIYTNASLGVDSGEDFDNEWFSENVIRSFAAVDEETQEPSLATGELRVSNKFYVLTSSAHRETSWGDDSGGLFASGIFKAVGLSGSMPADSGPKDGTVTVKELHSYVYDYVMRMASRFGETQHVQVYPSDSDYQLFIR
ncbi:MAG: caspase family protein [Oscillospiraceae bacterium]|nr:caspase family protein [Oscillospiraceae bacterium]